MGKIFMSLYVGNVKILPGILMLLMVYLPAKAQSNQYPSPIVEVKRELGNSAQGAMGGVLLNQNLSDSYEFSPLISGLGKIWTEIKIPGYLTKITGDIQLNQEFFTLVEHKNGSFVSHYYLKNKVILGYVLHDFLPVTYHGDELFLKQINTFPNDCNEYLNTKTVSSTVSFDCFKKEHDHYVEEYIFEVINEPDYVARILILDAFYPKILEQNAKQKINQIIDVVLSE